MSEREMKRAIDLANDAPLTRLSMVELMVKFAKEHAAAAVAQAKRDGGIEELERLTGKIGQQFVGSQRVTYGDIQARIAQLKGAPEHGH